MRIARRLSRPAIGRWSFVQRVPVELRVVLDCRLIKRTSGPSIWPKPRACGRPFIGCARLFAQLKDQRVVKPSKTDGDVVLARLTNAGKLQELTLNWSGSPDATVNLQRQIESPGAVESIHAQNVLAVSPYRSLELVAHVEAKLSTQGSLTVACLDPPQLRMSRYSICRLQASIAVMDDSQPKQDGKR